MASILGLFTIPSSSASPFIRTLHYDPSILDGPHCMAHSITEFGKPLHDKAVIHEGDFGNTNF